MSAVRESTGCFWDPLHRAAHPELYPTIGKLCSHLMSRGARKGKPCGEAAESEDPEGCNPVCFAHSKQRMEYRRQAQRDRNPRVELTEEEEEEREKEREGVREWSVGRMHEGHARWLKSKREREAREGK